MLKLRLMRMGKKKQPHYRVVAADSRSPRNGRFIEIVGTYDPRNDPSVVKIDNARALHWLRNGAQATERVQKLLAVTGAWQEFKGLPFDGPAPEDPGESTPAAAETAPAKATPVESEKAAVASESATPAEAEAGESE